MGVFAPSKSCDNRRAKVLAITLRTVGIIISVAFVHVQVRTQKSDFDLREKVARNFKDADRPEGVGLMAGVTIRGQQAD